MKSNHILFRVLCLVLCLMSLITLAMPAAAAPIDRLPPLRISYFSESMVVRSGVPVHYSSSSASLIIGYLENGTQLQVLRKSYKTVYRIKCFGMNGYIAKEYVREEDGQYYVSCPAEEGKFRPFEAIQEIWAQQIRQSLYRTASSYLGVRYRWGGKTPKGFDCSGYTQYVFEQHGITLPRTAQEQIAEGIIVDKENLKCGDLVFFRNTHQGSLVTHVGIYVGDGMMIHCASKGVKLESMDSVYYSQRYIGARRIILDYPDPPKTDEQVEVNFGQIVLPEEKPEEQTPVSFWDVVTMTDKRDIVLMIMFSPQSN